MRMEETKIILRNIGRINPNSIEDYVRAGGYSGLRKALTMKGEEIISLLKDSNLRGRGGAGFLTGLKWSFVAKEPSDQKYVICNADEGEPATNKDRVLMSGDPHSVIEGMAIAGYAVGANRGYIYLRAEYPYIFPVLERAIEKARACGYLGRDLFNSGFDFDIEVISGGGAYVCGEETALLDSIEGRQGEPRMKPPYPSVKGLYGKPTLINNVETLVNVPVIIEKGAHWYQAIGTPNSTGTKLYSLCGNIKNRGVFEYPMGVNLKDLIFKTGCGTREGRRILGVQLGGASGPIINSSQLDMPMDIEGAAAQGGSLGAGDVMVIDDSNDLLAVVENLLSFFVHESCGKCTPCREGNMRLLQTIRKIRNGYGRPDHIELLEDLCLAMTKASLCGLGQSSPIPVLSSLHNFRDIYETAIQRGHQP